MMSMNSVYVHKLTTWAFLFKNWWTIDIYTYKTLQYAIFWSSQQYDWTRFMSNKTLQVQIRKQRTFLSDLLTSYCIRSLLLLSNIKYLIPVSIQVNPIEIDTVENSIISTVSLKLILTGKIVIPNNWELV